MNIQVIIPSKGTHLYHSHSVYLPVVSYETTIPFCRLILRRLSTFNDYKKYLIMRLMNSIIRILKTTPKKQVHGIKTVDVEYI